VNSAKAAQEATFQDSVHQFTNSRPPIEAQFDGIDEGELVNSICEAIEDPNGPKSTTAFVEYFFGYSRGKGAKYQSAFKRVNELMDIEGLTWI